MDHDGRLNFEEFRRAIKNPPSSDDVEDTAFVIDASEEVMKALDSFEVGPEGFMEISKLIDYFEQQTKYKLTENQINVLMPEINGKFGKLDAKEFFLLYLFHKCDEDNNGFITYDETFKIAGIYDEKMMTDEENKKQRKYFHKADIDGNGQLDFEEFRKSIIGDSDSVGHCQIWEKV